MRVLVLGSGAKDQAVLWWLSKSNFISGLFIAPESVNFNYLAEVLEDIDPANPKSVLKAVKDNNIDLVFIGTEAPLLTNVVPTLKENNIKVIGAPPEAIKLEDNKAFARSFTNRYNIPVPNNRLFKDIKSVTEFLNSNKGESYVVKSNTMSPSRIMLSSNDTNALIEYAKTLLEKGPVLIEEKVDGLPITITVFLDNNGYLALPITSEYTTLSKSNTTLTGGLGAVCPVPLSDTIKNKINEVVIKPTLNGLKKEKLLYQGILTFSLILEHGVEPVLVDYHTRLNDPATQAMVPIINCDLCEILNAILKDEVSSLKIQTTDEYTVSVVLSTPNYPSKIETGLEIEGLTKEFFMELKDKPTVFSGAIKGVDGKVITTGGRAITVVGKGNTIIDANRSAYKLLRSKKFANLTFREDIGENFFKVSSSIE